jgi:hypothetical protein
MSNLTGQDLYRELMKFLFFLDSTGSPDWRQGMLTAAGFASLSPELTFNSPARVFYTGLLKALASQGPPVVVAFLAGLPRNPYMELGADDVALLERLRQSVADLSESDWQTHFLGASPVWTNMADYTDLEIGLYRQESDRYEVELRFRLPYDRVDQTSGRRSAEFDLAELRGLTREPNTYGQKLAASLFADPVVGETFEKVRVATEALDKMLRIRLFIDPGAGALSGLYWETLHDPRGGSWLLANDKILFSRYYRVSDGRPIQLTSKDRLRALVVIANPPGLAGDGFDVSRERSHAQQSLGSAYTRDTDFLVTEPNHPGRASLKNLLRALRADYDILYLVCHYAMRANGSSRQLVPHVGLEADDGSMAMVPGHTFVAEIARLPRRPRLIALASCGHARTESAQQSREASAWARLGPELVENGIPALLATQGCAPTDDLSAFMQVFFSEVGKHGRVDRAMAVARAGLQETAGPAPPDGAGSWDGWKPVLYTRLREGCISYSPGFRGEPSGLKRWPSLLNSIKTGKSIPVLGPGLLEYLVGPQREIAERLAKAEHFALAPHNQTDLPQVAQYVATTQSLEYMRDKYMECLRAQILQRHEEVLTEDERNAPLDVLISQLGKTRRQQDAHEPHRVLAQLRLPIYVTTNPDNLLAEALREAGADPQVEICRWHRGLADLPSIYAQKKQYRPTVDQPLIYHLFGQIQYPESLVITEDSYFDFMMQVSQPQTRGGNLPSVVTAGWSANTLLFLGFQIEDWNFRVLFRSILNEERRRARRDTQVRAVAAQVNPEEGFLEPEETRAFLQEYFQSALISIYWGSTEDFAEDLSRRWKA